MISHNNTLTSKKRKEGITWLDTVFLKLCLAGDAFFLPVFFLAKDRIIHNYCLVFVKPFYLCIYIKRL